ncbi:N-acetylmuramoyl-L-alanine amidase CwlD [Anaeromicropila herbilytica]|nr:N-acetylmuramoyl-L-alanine amidase CwlD [Anaeromicropila herbilytica]
MRKKYFNVVFLGLVIIAFICFSKKGLFVMNLIPDNDVNKVTVYLDAGHGGFDPGKVGVNQALEKDINLSITLKLKAFLEQNGINVIMTREDDRGLYQESDTNKKMADLKKRVELINESDAVIAVSIHQNSFPQENVKGAQVFYHQLSAEGKELAEILQEQIKQSIADGNKRVAKPNDSYYMLKKSRCPLVIVECGFLSNYTEASLLCDEGYQTKMAWAIQTGIMSYLNKTH